MNACHTYVISLPHPCFISSPFERPLNIFRDLSDVLHEEAMGTHARRSPLGLPEVMVIIMIVWDTRVLSLIHPSFYLVVTSERVPLPVSRLARGLRGVMARQKLLPRTSSR